ncbi:MAG TPA: cardiolipin synthase [Thermoanaerobaculia bacterium]|nr:cardiolipin synthase [Thermoanaerobaculia bacterium]
MTTNAPLAAGVKPRRGIARRRSVFVALLFVVAHVAGFLASVQAVMSVRTAQGAIAWVVSLNTLPWVAVPAYVLFGRSKFEGFVSLRRRGLEETSVQAKKFRDGLAEQDLIAGFDSDQAHLIEKLAKLPFTLSNDVDLLVDGQAKFDSLFAGIERAERYVLVQYYILRDDDIGSELKRRLIERADAGVRCHVLYDEVGTSDLPDAYVEELRAAGVEVRTFDTRRGPIDRLLQINFRNHRKIVVVDGREAWVGGFNVGDEYLGRDAKFGHWRDTAVRVAGPVVQSVQVSFVEDWHWATGKILDLEWRPVAASKASDGAVLALPSGPADQLETATLFFMHAISRARTRLWIATPYFVPDEQFVTALQLAALRGVDVRILVPEKSDSRLVNLSVWSYLADLERVGVRSFRHGKGFMHQKVMLVDDRLATVGTANFDNRSFRLNFEITMVVVADQDFARDVAQMLERDFADSREVFAKELQQRGLWFRVAVRAARLMAPLQ